MAEGVTAGGEFTIQFSDTQSGDTADAKFYANGHNQGVKGVLDDTEAGKNLVKVGHVNAVNLVANFDHLVVKVQNKNLEVVTATSQQTYKTFENIPINNLTITAVRSK